MSIHHMLKDAGIIYGKIEVPLDLNHTPEVKARYAESRREAALQVAQLLADDGILAVFYDEITFVNYQGKSKVYTYAEMDVSKDFEQKDRQVIQ